MATSTTAAPGSAVVVEPAVRLGGELRLPGDKSISHRALLLALLAEGTSRITDAGDGEDVRSTASIVETLGAEVSRTPSPVGVDYVVTSPGIDGLRGPTGVLDCGNSGTSMRLFAGILAGQPIRGDARRRCVPPEPADDAGDRAAAGDGRRRHRGAEGAPAADRSPGVPRFDAIDWATPVPSAQVKSAILLAGMRAEGTTRVRESVATRDHTERMLRASGVPVRTQHPPLEDAAATWATIEIDGRARPAPHRRARARRPVGGRLLAGRRRDPSRRRPACWAASASTRRAGRSIGGRHQARRVDARSAAAADAATSASRSRTSGSGSTSALPAIELDTGRDGRGDRRDPDAVPRGHAGAGPTVIRGAGELRHKESDRIAGIVAGLTALGARIEAVGDDIVIEGPTAASRRGRRQPRRPPARAHVRDRRPHRGGRTRPSSAPGCVDISYPTFFADLERIRS